MNEYISKEYIRNIVQKHWDDSCGAECYAYGVVLDDIAEAPIADAVEAKHGYWILRVENNICDMTYEYKCSKCSQLSRYQTNYCPNCGAYMRETYLESLDE